MNQGDGGTSSCPAAYECQPDPLLGALMYCGMPGELVPPECVTDEDCVRVGLPGATCLVQDDFGISGCLKTCT